VDRLGQRPPLPLEGFLSEVAPQLEEIKAREAAEARKMLAEALRLRDQIDRVERGEIKGRELSLEELQAMVPELEALQQEAAQLQREREYEASLLEVVRYHVARKLPLPPEVAEKFPQANTALAGLRGESAPAERSVGGLCDRWAERQWQQAAAGKIVNGRAAANEGCLKHFRAFLGEGADIEQAVTEGNLDSFYLHCCRKMTERVTDPKRKAGWSADYAKKVFDTARRFIRDLWELKWAEVTLPRNIDSKGFRFNAGPRAVTTWTVEEFQQVLAAAQTWRQMPLHLLLMANCGYRHQDIADVEQWEVDWLEGRIVRARSKIADQENAPVVNYKLWPATLELLWKHRNPDHGPHARVLVTESGRPWVWEEQVPGPDGKTRLKSSNNINSNFAHLRKRIGFDKPLSQIRKMGATLLNASKEYRDCVPEYLGESPTSIKDRHYVRPDPAHFDAALNWLGRQLGMVAAADLESRTRGGEYS
jgi:hypothetical protein